MKKAKKSELRYNEDDERTLLEDILGFIKVFVVSAIVILLFVNFVAHPVRVDGRSMYPTLKDGEFGFTNVGGVLLNGVKRGDIVVVTMEEKGQKTHWVKRVIGMPGDTISCVNDIVFINGKVLDETQYIDPDYRQSCVDQFGYFNKVPNADNTDVQDFEEVKLGDDEYYVMGDNRNDSKDSRYWIHPYVSKDKILGKAVFRYWPITEMKTIK
jgi:signal peptidase I